jgi:transcriptional regulator with XRE-family HTH domain
VSNKIKDEEKILSPEFLDEMKRVREQRGISIEEVAEKTNIKASYIRAIEEGDMSRLPGGPYNRAFIRSISEFLGIDTRPFERKVESDEMIKEKQVRIELGRPQNASVPSKLTIIGCLFLIFFLYSVFYGPRTSKKEQIDSAIENYQQQQIEVAQENIEKAKTQEEKDIINTELQAKISDETALIKKIPEVSPIKKETEEYVSKELIITLLATDNVKVLVKDFYGKLLLNKEMVANEAVMLNGSEEYSMITDNVNHLEIYLDGVQIRDTKKIERNGRAFVFRAEKLVNIAENQPVVKKTVISSGDSSLQQAKPAEEAAINSNVQQQTPTETAPNIAPSADKTQNNPQGSSR